MSLSNVYTTLPGYVVTYDGVTVTARPAQDKMLANGESLKPPKIVKVPVYWPTADGGKAIISVPLKPGDNIVLHFAARSIENWLSGSDQAPDDPRQFDLSDAFCTPVLRPGVRSADTENVSIEYGVGWMKIAPTGDITFQAPNITANVENAATVNATTLTATVSGATQLDTGTLTVNASQTTYNSPVTINGPLTYTQGVTGSGGGGAAFTGGTVTHNGVQIGDTHKHSGVSSGPDNTGNPI